MEGGCGLGLWGWRGRSPSVFLPSCPSPIFLYRYCPASMSTPPCVPPLSPFHISPVSFSIFGLLTFPPSAPPSFFPIPIPLSGFFPSFSPFSVFPSTILPLVYCSSPLSLSPSNLTPSKSPSVTLHVHLSDRFPTSDTPPHTPIGSSQ